MIKKTVHRPNAVRKALFFVAASLVIFAVFDLGYRLGKNNYSILPNFKPTSVVNSDAGKPAEVDFSLFWEAWNKLKDKSVAETDPQKMMYGAISGVLSSVNDPYTVFFTPEENKRFREDIQGEFDGIGIEIVSKDNLPTVVAPLSETPAEKAGIKAGDIITEVDGTKTSEIGLNEVIDKIRGTKGTKVKLKIVREGKDQPMDFEVERDTIVVKSVEWEYKQQSGKTIAYVKVRQFGDDTDALFDDFVNDVAAKKPDGVVVDLRNNPGGYLESAINLSSYFVDGGTVVIERNKQNQDKNYNITKKAKLKNYKTVVLVNQGSASASEIFSGALQDRKAGKLIGEKTFGKGSVQELIELSDGSAAKITVAKWLTPSGRTINGEGIEPDIKINDDEATTADEQLDRALSFVVEGK